MPARLRRHRKEDDPRGAGRQRVAGQLAANLLVALNTAALAEALVLGAKGGLAPQVLLDILKDSAGGSRMVDVRGPLMVEHRFEPQMKLDLFLKDFRLMLEEGQRLGVPLPLTSLTQQLCTATVAAGRGGEDLAALITTLETMAGLGSPDGPSRLVGDSDSAFEGRQGHGRPGRRLADERGQPWQAVAGQPQDGPAMPIDATTRRE